MTYYPEFARLLNEKLQRQDRTASWLAQRLGVTPTTVTRWLNHATRPGTPEIIVQIADVLGITAQRQALLVAAGYGFQEAPPADEAREPANHQVQAASHDVVANLPVMLTSFVGRADEIEELSLRLRDPSCRLLTLVGPGGIGKTRLAIAVAAVQKLPAVYVPLQAVTFPELLPSAIADAADIKLSGHEPLAEQLLQRLRDRQLLLVLDNFEQLLDRAELLGELLHHAPAVQSLVTSREAIKLREEWLYHVRGLPVPSPDEQGDPAAYAAIQLFTERALQVRNDFRLEDEVEHVLSICRAVEGMPLAIELAAAWLSTLDCAAIADRLHHNLDLLTTPLRNMPERHRSIRAVFDGSWQLLSVEERAVLMRLAVFQGGFTFEVAPEVAGATLPILSALVTKSLIRREGDGRYQMHVLLRQYAGENMASTPEYEYDAFKAHSEYFMRFLSERTSSSIGHHQRQVAEDIGTELQNVRKAWQWAVDQFATASIFDAGWTLRRFCQIQSRYVEGADLFRQASIRLERDRMTVERVTVLAAMLAHYGMLCIRLGHLDNAEYALTRASQLCQQHDISPTPQPFTRRPE